MASLRLQYPHAVETPRAVFYFFCLYLYNLNSYKEGMAKRVFIIHGWGAAPDQHWQPWLKRELEERGFEVSMPAMPNTDEPEMAVWVGALASAVGELNEETYFVGHSIGCQTIMRYLATQAGKKAGGCVFVAGWFKLENMESEEEEVIAQPWLTEPIDFEAIKRVTSNITVFLSDNDFYGAVQENKEMFERNLGARVVVEHEMGHYTEDDGVTQVPQVLEVLLTGGAN